MCIKTILELCHSLPTELALRILTEGARDPEYGTGFGIKCLLLARWVQREIAPIVYHSVAIGNESQARSLLLAIAQDIHRKEYKVTSLLRSFVIRDQSRPPGENYETLVSIIIRALEHSDWQHFAVPLPLLSAIEKKFKEFPKLPASLSYMGTGSMFADYSYDNVVRIRVADRNAGMWELKGLMAIAKKATHLAIKISANPWQGMSIVHQLAGIDRVECLVIAVDISPNEEYVSELLDLKASPMDHLPTTDLSKTLIWKWDDEVDKLYHDEDDEFFWEKAMEQLT